MNFQVADWHVDVDANRIHNSEQDVKLESKVMALLTYLAQHQGDVVSREQLEADVWSDRVISYDALTSCITRLRKVLGDDSRKPVYIETVPKKGYRLIAPVVWPQTAPVPQIETSTDDKSGAHPRRWQTLLAVILLTSIAGIALFSITQITEDKRVAVSDKPSIIVLPFDNLSNEAGQRYFSDGITADISIALSKLSGLQVIASPSMLTDNNVLNATAINQDMPLARYVLSGSVQRADRQLRVNVMLIDNSTHHQLWADSYDREITAVFEVQDEITARIVSTLSIKLTEEEKRRVAHRYTNSIEAYDQFLRGQALYTQHTSNENLLAIEHLRQAIELDPNFARAYSTLSLCYIDEYRYQWFSDPDKALLTTLSLAEKAVAIDDQLPQAHWAVSYAQLHMHHYERAKEAISLALAKTPNYADGYALLALINIYSGDAAEGLKMIRRAIALNPDHPAQYVSVLGQAYYYLGDYEEALAAFRDALDKNFSLRTAQIMMTVTLSKSGMPEEASWSGAQLHTLMPEFRSTDVGRVFPINDAAQLRDIVKQLAAAGIE